MKNKNLQIFFLSFIIIGLFAVPYLVLGQSTGSNPPPGTGSNPPCPDGTLCNPVPNITSFTQLLKTILEGLIKIGIPIIALAIIYSGFLFVFARGNSEQLKKAKSALMYTLIGAAILLGSWAIAQMISDTVIELGR